MAISVGDFTITEYEDFALFGIGGDYMFTLDELQNINIEQTEDNAPVTGKGGRTINNLKRNKGVHLTGANGLVSAGMLEVQTGGKFTSGVTEVKWTDHLVVNTNAATTNYKATGTVGNEIESVYVKNANGTIDKVLTQNSTVAEGKFAYDPGTKVLSFNQNELADGTEIEVHYTRKISGNVLSNLTDSYSGKATGYLNVLCEDKCNNVYRGQFYFPRLDFNGNFSMELGDSQVVHNFEANSLSGAGCGGNIGGGKLWDFTVFGANAEDAA